MGQLSTALNAIKEIKENLKMAILAKGGNLNGRTFAEYPSAIAELGNTNVVCSDDGALLSLSFPSNVVLIKDFGGVDTLTSITIPTATEKIEGDFGSNLSTNFVELIIYSESELEFSGMGGVDFSTLNVFVRNEELVEYYQNGFFGQQGATIKVIEQ